MDSDAWDIETADEAVEIAAVDDWSRPSCGERSANEAAEKSPTAGLRNYGNYGNYGNYLTQRRRDELRDAENGGTTAS